MCMHANSIPAAQCALCNGWKRPVDDAPHKRAEDKRGPRTLGAVGSPSMQAAAVGALGSQPTSSMKIPNAIVGCTTRKFNSWDGSCVRSTMTLNSKWARDNEHRTLVDVLKRFAR